MRRASSPIAKAAKDQGILTVAVVTRPFFFEGNQRMQISERAIDEIRKEVDALIVIPNDRLLSLIDKNTTFANAFATCDEILRQAVEGISDLITMEGIVNVDFADIRAVMANAGPALMGIGRSAGENRAIEAAKAAINSPLLDVSIEGAKGVLFAIAGDQNMTMFEIQEAAKVIIESIDSNAKVIFGAFRDDKLNKNEIKVTVIASGFPENAKRKPIINNESKGLDDSKIIITDNNDAKSLKKPEPIKNIKSQSDTVDEDEEDWSSIPAFLRRPKQK